MAFSFIKKSGAKIVSEAPARDTKPNASAMSPQAKFIAALEEQILVVSAAKDGKEYKVTKKVYRGKGDARKLVEDSVQPRSWSWVANKRYFTDLRYGVRAMPLDDSGKTTLEVAGWDEMIALYREIQKAAKAGEFDALLSKMGQELVAARGKTAV
jgi:hypothetical protein